MRAHSTILRKESQVVFNFNETEKSSKCQGEGSAYGSAEVLKGGLAVLLNVDQRYPGLVALNCMDISSP